MSKAALIVPRGSLFVFFIAYETSCYSHLELWKEMFVMHCEIDF